MSSPALRADPPENSPFVRHTAPHDRDDKNPIAGGPPLGLEKRLGLLAPGRPNLRLRAILSFVLAWLIPLLICTVQSLVSRDGSFTSFVGDYGMYARSAIATPLLVLAEGVCFPRLGAIVSYFRTGNLIVRADAIRYDAALQTTLAWRDSLRLELAAVAVAVALVFALDWTIPETAYQAWHRSVHAYSVAGWWNALVSVPILVVLLLGWLWRLALWTRFLWLMSRLDLNIIPAHPDGAGGLKFVGLSVQALSVIAFCCGIVMAGSIMNRIGHAGASLLSYDVVIPAFVLVMLALFVGPVLVFAPKLLEARRQGIFAYGALAHNLGTAMEQKWIHRSDAVTETSLEAPDFSATTDLYSIAANAYGMNIVPLELVSLVLLVVSALVPFVPALLMSFSLAAVLEKLTSIFL